MHLIKEKDFSRTAVSYFKKIVEFQEQQKSMYFLYNQNQCKNIKENKNATEKFSIQSVHIYIKQKDIFL